MSVISRVSLVRGPALLTLRGASFFTKEDFNIAVAKETMKVSTSAHGEIDEREIEINTEASFTPEGRWLKALINGVYNPFGNMKKGTSLLGYTTSGDPATITATNSATNFPFVASANDGQIHTMIAACITKLPDIFLSAKKTMLGSMTVKGYRGDGMGWADASSLYTIATTGGSVTDSTFSPGGIIVQPYSAAWGTNTGFAAFDTQEGWTISFNLKTTPIPVDSNGATDLTFDSIEVMAKCIPVGPTASNILAAANIQGANVQRGQSMQKDISGTGTTPDLVITGLDGTTVITLSACQLKTAGYGFGAARLRAGEVGFVATRKFSAGAQQALFTMAAGA